MYSINEMGVSVQWQSLVPCVACLKGRFCSAFKWGHYYLHYSP